MATNTVLVTALLLQRWGPSGELGAALLLPPLLLILGEIIRKSMGRQQATSLVLSLAPAIWVISWVFYPVTTVFAAVSRGILFVTGARRTSHLPFITREDLRLVVQKSGPEVDLESAERLIIHRILQFSLRTVKEVMVPLIRVTAIPDTLAGAGVRFAPKDFERAAELLGLLAFDDGLRASVIDGQRRRVAQFTTARLDHELRRVLERFS